MPYKAPFLNVPYGAYYHREVPREDEELTHVGPGTPAGEYLRRFWHPVALSDDLKDVPKAIRIMGEDLVAFRDKSGNVGVLERHCSHRGTSLEFGQVQTRGIRCCYHGWLYDIDGRILEMPGEPPESTLKQRLCHGAYPIREYEGMIFAYMGPPDRKPELPIYDSFVASGFTTSRPSQELWACNWLQMKENSMDPFHTQILHMIEPGHDFSESFREHGVLDWLETPVGLAYAFTRRVGDNVWVRIVDYVRPTIHNVPTVAEDGKKEHDFSFPALTTHWLVPVDDTNSLQFTVGHLAGSEKGEPIKFFGQQPDRPYEERQRVPGDYDAQVSQRPIARHALEHLGATDRGITLLRKMLREEIRSLRRGEDPRDATPKHGQVIPTYAGNAVVRIPPAITPEDDRRLLFQTGRRMAEQLIRARSVVSTAIAD